MQRISESAWSRAEAKYLTPPEAGPEMDEDDEVAIFDALIEKIVSDYQRGKYRGNSLAWYLFGDGDLYEAAIRHYRKEISEHWAEQSANDDKCPF